MSPTAPPLRALLERLEGRRLFASTRFAVIGDFGSAGQPEADVAALVKSWDPDFIVTTGDNNYETGSADTIDANIGQYYHEYIYNYRGAYGAGSSTRRFLPALGNHDWGSDDNPTGADPHLNYFDLPGNERYYEFAAGPARIFVMDSDANEPDGITRTSVQAEWLRARLAASTEQHKVVVFHHPPYSSGSHGDTGAMRWPFSQWGATAVLSGHEHSYEQLFAEGIPYFVNGVGGRSIYGFGEPSPASQFRYADDYGAQLVTADETTMRLQLFSRAGALVHDYTLDLTARRPIVSVAASTASPLSESASSMASPSFTVSRAGPDLSHPLVVPLSLDGTASNGTDHDPIPDSVTIPAGASSVVVPVRVFDDTVAEPLETIRLSLVASAALDVGLDAAASLSITDDDGQSLLLLPGGGAWRYKDDGTDEGAAWRAPSFDDSGWSLGNARFGYGDPDIATTINAGPGGARIITHYFRTGWTLADFASVASATLNVLRDDGAVIHLNGVEIARSNMPGGAVAFDTRSSSTVGGPDETTFFAAQFDPALLAADNVLAVELHQANRDTSDAVFDLLITGLRDVSAPALRGAAFHDETDHSIRLRLSEDVVGLSASDLVVTNLTTGQTLASDAFSLTHVDGTWRFTATHPLSDGRYSASLAAGAFTDGYDNANVAVTVVSEFAVLAGDANRDRVVNFADLVILAQNYNQLGRTFSQGNFDYSADGTVNFADLVILAQRYNTSLHAPATSRAVAGAAGTSTRAAPRRRVPLSELA